MLLCLWYRPVATAPIRPLVWETPYVSGWGAGWGQKDKKRNGRKEDEKEQQEHVRQQEHSVELRS